MANIKILDSKGSTQVDEKEILERFDVKPYPSKKRQGVIFKLVNIRQDPEPENGGRFMVPSFYNIPTRIQVKDRQGNMVDITYVSHQVPTDKGWMDATGEEINFVRGRITVSPADKPLYYFLCLHPECQSNTSKYPGINPTFLLDDPEIDKTNSLKTEEEYLDAIVEFRHIYDNKDLICVFAKSIGVDVEQEMAAIKHDVIQRLKDNPSLIKKLFTFEVIAKAVVHEAFDLDILDFDSINSVIKYKATNTKITDVPYGTEEPKDFFAYWLERDTSRVFDALYKVVTEKRSDFGKNLTKVHELFNKTLHDKTHWGVNANREDQVAKEHEAVPDAGERPEGKAVLGRRKK